MNSRFFLSLLVASCLCESGFSEHGTNPTNTKEPINRSVALGGDGGNLPSDTYLKQLLGLDLLRVAINEKVNKSRLRDRDDEKGKRFALTSGAMGGVWLALAITEGASVLPALPVMMGAYAALLGLDLLLISGSNYSIKRLERASDTALSKFARLENSMSPMEKREALKKLKELMAQQSISEAQISKSSYAYGALKRLQN